MPTRISFPKKIAGHDDKLCKYLQGISSWPVYVISLVRATLPSSIILIFSNIHFIGVAYDFEKDSDMQGGNRTDSAAFKE